MDKETIENRLNGVTEKFEALVDKRKTWYDRLAEIKHQLLEYAPKIHWNLIKPKQILTRDAPIDIKCDTMNLVEVFNYLKKTQPEILNQIEVGYGNCDGIFYLPAGSKNPKYHTQRIKYINLKAEQAEANDKFKELGDERMTIRIKLDRTNEEFERLKNEQQELSTVLKYINV